MHVKCALGSAAKTWPWFLLCVSPIRASTGPTHGKHRKERGDGRKEINRFGGWEIPKKSKVMVRCCLPREARTSTSWAWRYNRNWGMHSIIQVLKEQPELSRKDQEGNLTHSKLVHLPRRFTWWIQLVYTAGSTSPRRRLKFILLGAPISRGRRWDLEALH